jgi:uncharacterized lipoprotein YddW (UPF0748 family)
VDRRTFLKSAALAALNTKVLACDQGGRPRPQATVLKNWVWVTVDTNRPPDGWKRLFGRMRENNVRAVLPGIYDGRRAYFPSRRLPVGPDLLGTILPLAQAEGLEVHAWMWSMPCLIPEILAQHPDWYNVNALGESAANKPAYVDYYKFLDPGRPEVREWVQGTVKELAAIPQLTGIHLDYIRHPDAILPRGLWKKYNIVQDKVYPAYDYGYSEYERAQFKKRHGIDPLKIARREVQDPDLEQAWFQFQLDMVVDLVNIYLAPAAHAQGKTITAAVFPGPSLARELVRQDWGRFQIDAFLPMLYNGFYEEGPAWVRQETREGVSAVNRAIYSGLFIHDMNTETLFQTVQMALEGGASGISLFSGDGMDDAKWAAFRSATAPA